MRGLSQRQFWVQLLPAHFNCVELPFADAIAPSAFVPLPANLLW
jgi:hypothetical protein